MLKIGSATFSVSTSLKCSTQVSEINLQIVRDNHSGILIITSMEFEVATPTSGMAAAVTDLKPLILSSKAMHSVGFTPK